jgi:RNA polymerase sigma-70 factor, ECF subfamily
MRREPAKASSVEFKQTLLLHLVPLHRRALRLARSPSLAEDLVQDTMERALRHAQHFRSGSNMRGWLCTIMSNLYIDGCRLRSHEVYSRSGMPPEIAAPEVEKRPVWDDVSFQDVQGLLPQLSPDLRRAMQVFLEGKPSYRELSAKLGIPMSTVGTRLLRARRRLRELLEQKCINSRACEAVTPDARSARRPRSPELVSLLGPRNSVAIQLGHEGASGHSESAG